MVLSSGGMDVREVMGWGQGQTVLDYRVKTDGNYDLGGMGTICLIKILGNWFLCKSWASLTNWVGMNRLVGTFLISRFSRKLRKLLIDFPLEFLHYTHTRWNKDSFCEKSTKFWKSMRIRHDRNSDHKISVQIQARLDLIAVPVGLGFLRICPALIKTPLSTKSN